MQARRAFLTTIAFGVLTALLSEATAQTFSARAIMMWCPFWQAGRTT